MKSFFAPVAMRPRSDASGEIGGTNAASPVVPATHRPAENRHVLQGRIAIYDSTAAAPRVHEVRRDDPREFIEELASHTYMFASELGGSLPYTVIREVVENLIHADFHEVVLSVLESGSELRIADQGPGIRDKERAVRPGFTTASSEMKRFIRGVGSGLPIVKEFLSHSGGSLSIEDNLGSGTVVIIRAGNSTSPGDEMRGPAEESSVVEADPTGDGPSWPKLTLRQNRVLSLVMELGEAGPSLVSRELKVGLSTAHRDLGALEDHGLLVSDESGKRFLTSAGNDYLDSLVR